jgi:hypothetical protein
MKVLNNSCLKLSSKPAAVSGSVTDVSGSVTDVSKRKCRSSRNQTLGIACTTLLYAHWITAVEQAGGTDMHVHMYGHSRFRNEIFLPIK